MVVSDLLMRFEERMGGYLTEEEKLSHLLEFEATETENYFLKLDENSSLSIPDAFSNLYFLYLKLKAQAKAKEMINYANTSMEFLSLYSDYKRGKMRRAGVQRQDIKYY